jgi:cytochrome o ubiquinol oxidase subunit 1
VGAVLVLAGILCQAMQLIVSIRHREELRDVTGDPWMGRSLEWSTSSPPPAFNFAVLPVVEDRDDYWRRARLAERGLGPAVEPIYKPIEMPRNSPTGFICAFFAFFAGFGMIWQIWWLVIVALIGAFATFVVFAWRDRTEYQIPAEEVARIDRANRRARGEAVATVEALS